MAFRPAFDCLWCGRHHDVRSRTDIEGFAQLCPDCMGRAGANPFLRSRVRAALADRAAALGGVERRRSDVPGADSERHESVGPASDRERDDA